MSKTAEVTILHNDEKHTYTTRKGFGFQAFCAKNKTPIEFDCRDADCGICSIRVLKGAENLSEKEFKERDFLKAMLADSDERLACQCRIFGDLIIELDF